MATCVGRDVVAELPQTCCTDSTTSWVPERAGITDRHTILAFLSVARLWRLFAERPGRIVAHSETAPAAGRLGGPSRIRNQGETRLRADLGLASGGRDDASIRGPQLTPLTNAGAPAKTIGAPPGKDIFMSFPDAFEPKPLPVTQLYSTDIGLAVLCGRHADDKY